MNGHILYIKKANACLQPPGEKEYHSAGNTYFSAA